MYNNYDDFYNLMGHGKYYCTRWVLSLSTLFYLAKLLKLWYSNHKKCRNSHHDEHSHDHCVKSYYIISVFTVSHTVHILDVA